MSGDDRASGTMAVLDGPRILLVDDEAWARRSLERVLASSGYRVHAVESGEAALQAINSTEYDVVLSDLSMPGLSGLELLRGIRRQDLDLPVLLITGNPSVPTAMDAVEYGALRYLIKPVDPELLRRAVGSAVRLRHLARLRRELVGITAGSCKQIADRAGLEVRFEKAMSRLYFVYQPVVKWSERSVIGYEVFVRSSEPSLADSQALFDAAERLDRVQELGRAIRARASGPLCEGPGRPLLFLNIHELELLDDTLYERAGSLAGLAERVVLEISERARLEAVGGIPRRVRDLKMRGFRIAIDDVGAGYAGLSSFSILEPDLIKFDVGLVRDVDHALGKRCVMRSMITVCRELGIEVIAEGVETRAELDTLVDLGCDVLQGYLFARPTAKLPESGVSFPFSRDPAASA
ncbi:MAG TPA: EAL domain-containing protein [Polyangiaceae bacterium]|nr:EAL domain-containing protein [Polyangiaceae bacterium]